MMDSKLNMQLVGSVEWTVADFEIPRGQSTELLNGARFSCHNLHERMRDTRAHSDFIVRSVPKPLGCQLACQAVRVVQGVSLGFGSER